MAAANDMRVGRCVNIGNCASADTRKTIQVPVGADFVCPECGKSLVTLQGPVGPAGRGVPAWAIAAGVVVALGLAGLAVLSFGHGSGAGGGFPLGGLGKPEPNLRLGGSNTIGDKLGPALAEGWLKSQGCADIEKQSPAKDELVLTCKTNIKTLVVTVAAHGTKTGFDGLKTKTYDVAMASDQIDRVTAADLSGLGDMNSPAAEHIIGLDGVAIVVNPANRVASLTLSQVADLFGGRISDWSQLGATAGPVTVFARDENSGTWKFFKRQVLDTYGAKLRADAQRFEKGSELSDGVAAATGGIGFVGAGSAQVARPVPIVSQNGGEPLLANSRTIGTEDYALSRRLYLYVPQREPALAAMQFLAFVDSTAGKQIVTANGFVSRDVAPPPAADSGSSKPRNAPHEYLDATGSGDRLNTNFFFASGSSELDNRALGDLDLVANYLSQHNIPPERLLLIGFTDDRGGDQANLRLSESRARAIAEALRTRQVSPGGITGFGKALPIRDNSTEEGRSKNRRVEVWIRP